MLPDGESGVLKIDFGQNQKIMQTILNGDIPDTAVVTK